MASEMMDDTSFLLTSLLSSLEFVVEIPKQLVCDRCDQAAIRPWRAKCKHLFCCRCLNEIMRGLQKCPLDGKSTILGEIYLEKETDDAVRKLLVRCLYLKQGCGNIVVLGKLMDHVHVCEYLPVYCPKDCGLTVSRKDVIQHLISSCPKSTSQQETSPSKPIKRWSSIRSMVGSSPHLDSIGDATMPSKPNNMKIMELASQVQQLNSNIHQLLREIKPQTDKSFIPYETNKIAKKSCSVSDLIRDANRNCIPSIAEQPNLWRFELNYPTNTDNVKMRDKSVSFIDKILDMLQELTVKIHGLDAKMATRENVNSNAVSIMKKMDSMQASLQLHQEILENIESNQDKLKVSLRDVMKSMTKNGQSFDQAIKYLEDFNTKMDTQNDIWLNMMGNIRQPRPEDSGLGQLIWKIDDYTKRKQRAILGQEIELYSPPFFSHQYGYKLCLRAYLNGYCDGAGTHLSLYICVLRGPFDDTLSWPFRGKFKFSILDQINRDKKEHFVQYVDPKKMGNFVKWCQKPETERNVGFGLPEFISHKILENHENGYFLNDTIYVKIVLDSVKESGHRTPHAK